MSTPNPNPPAFPCIAPNCYEHTGMELRDWFASQETLGEVDQPDYKISFRTCEILAGRPAPKEVGSMDYFKWEAEWRAALKYIRADAMIEVRKKK